MKEIVVYSVTLSGTHELEADSTQDAQDKTIVYFANNLTELDYSVTERTIWIEEEE